MSSDSLSGTVLALFLAAVLYCLFGSAAFTVQVIVWVALASVIAAAFRFVMLVGEFNLATGAFYGIGAYTAGYLSTALGWPLVPSLLAAAAIAGVVAVLLGYATLRTTGAYFMLISFAFSEIVRLGYIETPALGGNNGILGILVPLWLEPYFPAIVVLACALLVVAMALIERSTLGKIFLAIKNREEVVKSVGINVLAVRILCLTIAGMAAAVAGGLYGFVANVIAPGDFGFMVSVFALAYVKLGGETHPTGPIIGAAILTVVAQMLLGFGTYDQLLYGGIIVLAILALPEGLLGRIEQLGLIKQTAAHRPRAGGHG